MSSVVGSSSSMATSAKPRIAKRSVIGTRVSVPLESGFYVSGVIHSVRTPTPDAMPLYSVYFDSERITSSSGHRRASGEYPAEQMIGVGFVSSLSSRCSAGYHHRLLPTQKVFVTFNGREVAASVISYALDSDDEVVLSLDALACSSPNKDSLLLLPTQPSSTNNNLNNRMPMQIKRRLDEVRLLASRKSARLQEVDTDYARIALGSMDIRKRSSSMSSSASWASIDFSMDEGIELEDSNQRRRQPVSESINAMQAKAAKTMMSMSKKDGRAKNGYNENINQGTIYICLWRGCGLTYESCSNVEHHVRTVHLGKAEATTRTLCPEDEDEDDHEEEFYYTELDPEELNQFSASSESPISSSICQLSSTPSTSTDDSQSTNQSPNSSPVGLSESDATSGGRNNEVFMFVGASSAPTLSHMDMVRPPSEDPEYQRSVAAAAVTATIFPVSSPINIPSVSNGFSSKSKEQGAGSWISSKSFDCRRSPKSCTDGSKFMRIHSNSKQLGSSLLKANGCSSSSCYGSGCSLLATSGGGISKRSRNDSSSSRKCRKVYGMDHREAWCTQCKWKKACSRFNE